jgi:hypothetical protein
MGKKRTGLITRLKKMELINKIRSRINNKIKKMGLINKY